MTTAASKSATFAQFMDRGAFEVTEVILDGRHEGVVLPEQWASQAAVKLNFAWGYARFSCSWDDVELRAMLTFTGTPYNCVLPWSAVFEIRPAGGEGVAWVEGVPFEVVAVQAQPAEPAPKPERAKPGGGHLRLVRPEDVN